MTRVAIIAILALSACVPEMQTTKKPAEPMVQVPCQAAAYQSFLGHHKRDIRAAKIQGSIVRILTPDSPVTLDYNKDRLNFILNEDDIIQRVMCG